MLSEGDRNALFPGSVVKPQEFVDHAAPQMHARHEWQVCFDGR